MMIADRIRILRQRNNWSQTELAEKLGITRSSVNAWELGLSTPATKTIVELTGIFHVSSDYLLGVDTNPDIINLEGYSEKEKALVRDLLNYFSENRKP